MMICGKVNIFQGFAALSRNISRGGFENELIDRVDERSISEGEELRTGMETVVSEQYAV